MVEHKLTGFTVVPFVIRLQGIDETVCFSLSDRLNEGNLKEVSLLLLTIN